MQCCICTTDKSPKFYNAPDGSGKWCKKCYLKDNYQANKTARKAQKKDKYATDPEIRAGYERRRAENAHKKPVYNANRRSKYAANPKEELTKRKKWINAHPHIKRAHNAKYRASLVQAVPPWLKEEHFKQIEDFYFRKPTGMHVDHIVPLNGKEVCGLHVPWNLQYLTPLENSKKNNKF